ncbi:MAG: acetyl-CoA carboxylase carboxyl transferase subunit beta [Elusimicrobia bacterium HGW-Elusimicrobia-4]|nr:MAG: acetyl-CoA carboxylase carboxyl transferase subunit beta [Elusimicrobia bacterium HGW-Elusimicrobia-4]
MPVEEPNGKVSVPDGLWKKCDGCHNIIYNKELEENFSVCPKCGYYFRFTSKERIIQILDENSFEEIFGDLQTIDILSFKDTQEYSLKIKHAKNKTKLNDAVITGFGKIDGRDAVICIMDFDFMGGSMGSVVGEKITRAVETAVGKKLPLIIVSSSGGARMQEGMFSLMQMAKTSAALAKLSEAKLPFISVLTHPVTGGVAASFAMLGDVIIAEPKALIGFAGPRVIEQTIKQKLPDGVQLSEFLLSHGQIDIIAERKELKGTIARVIDLLY